MGNRVRIGGYELWKIDNDELISESKGRFDAVEYERQLKHGVAGVLTTWLISDKSSARWPS
jgi:hypothetical protein